MCAAGPQGDEPASPAPAYSTVPAPARTRFGSIRRFAEIDSTNRYLLDEARVGAPEGTVAVADYQSAGRGRLGRRWEAPPGSNLLASVLLRPDLAIEELHLCTVAVALAAAGACTRAAALEAQLKWPNDLMIGRRKLGGILAEATAVGPGPGGAAGGGPAVVVGLGLNVRWPAGDTAPQDGDEHAPAGQDEDNSGDEAGSQRADVAQLATSLGRESGRALEPMDLLAVLLEELEGRLVELDDHEGRRRLAAEYRRRCDTIGKEVRVTLAGEVFTGTATDISPEGHLVVDVGTSVRTVAAGDVVHLRNSG